MSYELKLPDKFAAKMTGQHSQAANQSLVGLLLEISQNPANNSRRPPSPPYAQLPLGHFRTIDIQDESSSWEVIYEIDYVNRVVGIVLIAFQSVTGSVFYASDDYVPQNRAFAGPDFEIPVQGKAR